MLCFWPWAACSLTIIFAFLARKMDFKTNGNITDYWQTVTAQESLTIVVFLCYFGVPEI
jgi:hypothetical protein